MKYVLWHSASESSYTFIHEGDATSDHFRPQDARVIWTVDADTYEEALQKRNDFLGWGEYKTGGLTFDYPPPSKRNAR